MTLVQPEGVLTPNRAVVSVDAGSSVRRASGALMTGQRQGRPIAAPVTAASRVAHDDPDAPVGPSV